MENVVTKLGKLSISESTQKAIPNRLPKILVAATGTPSARRLPEICAALASFGEVKVILTLDSHQYIDRQTLGRSHKVYSDEDEWTHPGDKPLSHDLAQWADVFVIAPVSPNTLVQIALGLCYNLVTSVAQIWSYERKRMLLFPDMDEKMWINVTTQAQVHNSLERNTSMATPSGRMAETHVVVDYIRSNLIR